MHANTIVDRKMLQAKYVKRKSTTTAIIEYIWNGKKWISHYHYYSKKTKTKTKNNKQSNSHYRDTRRPYSVMAKVAAIKWSGGLKSERVRGQEEDGIFIR